MAFAVESLPSWVYYPVAYIHCIHEGCGLVASFYEVADYVAVATTGLWMRLRGQ
jgi:hypothetical protein